MPSWPPSRPIPLCLEPPNGAAGSLTCPRFRPTIGELSARLLLAEIESGPQNQGAVQSLLGVQRDNGTAPGRPGRPGRLSALWQ